MMASPLLAVLMLRELGMTPWQYGVALGAPCLGAVLGARLAPLLTRRFGLHRVLIAFGVLRTPWLLLLPLAPPSVAGMVVIVLAQTGLMLVAGFCCLASAFILPWRVASPRPVPLPEPV
ncbi:MAG: hypothetical protein QOG10_6686 [Kribbellaceae bacterium]|nr:hypothetical protein [Kribbellaceae bacterium]